MPPKTTSSSKAAAAPKKQEPPHAPTNVKHGVAFEAWWKETFPTEPLPQPKVVCASNEEARPGYQSRSASEYNDLPKVLNAKVDFLIQMMKNSKFPVAYTGAGISSSIIPDYASRSAGSTVRVSEASGNRKLLPPTPSHRILAALFKAGHLKYHLDQNHDCLGIKAGIPVNVSNFIHGHWYDVHNRVLSFDEKLRPDLLEQMMEWANNADFVLTIGSSIAGMTADSVAEQVARRFVQGPHKDEASQDRGQGLAILTIQETRLDDFCSLKIYGPIEVVMKSLQEKLKLKVESKTYDVPRFPPPPRRTTLTKKN